MIYLQLYLEFFKIGLFSIGGGLATIPFLQDLGERSGWYTQGELAQMIAVSESTPGPVGINMATYVGYETAGLLGGILATLGTITPSIVIIVLISKVLNQFRESSLVQGIFYGIRPASAGLIGAAALQVAQGAFSRETDMGAVLFPAAVALGLLLWGLMYHTKWKGFHPIIFLLISGVLGGLFAL